MKEKWITSIKIEFVLFISCLLGYLHSCFFYHSFCCTVKTRPYFCSHVMHPPPPLSSLILSLSVRMYMSPSAPALECESSPLPSAYLPHHLRPGMATRSKTPSPLHVSQSDSAMLRKYVSFSGELLLAASGRTHPINLDLWPWGAVTSFSVTTPTPVLFHARFWYKILTNVYLDVYLHNGRTMWCLMSSLI